MRNRGRAIREAASAFHLDLPAFPTSGALLECPHVLPSMVQYFPCSGSYCSFLGTLCSSQGTTSCFLTIPMLPQNMPCSCLFSCLLESYLSFKVQLQHQSLHLSESAQTDVISFLPQPLSSSEVSSCLVRNVRGSLSLRECEPLTTGCLSYTFYSSSFPICQALF